MKRIKVRCNKCGVGLWIWGANKKGEDLVEAYGKDKANGRIIEMQCPYDSGTLEPVKKRKSPRKGNGGKLQILDLI